MLSSLMLDIKKSTNNRISTIITSENIKSFDTDLEPTIFNLANGTVILKFNHSAILQKNRNLKFLYLHFKFVHSVN